MKRILALNQSRGPGWDRSQRSEDQPGWIAHAEFMDRLVDEGFIALGGPLEGSHDVLLILRASSEQEIEQRLAADIWRQSELLVPKQCFPWHIRLGALD